MLSYTFSMSLILRPTRNKGWLVSCIVKICWGSRFISINIRNSKQKKKSFLFWTTSPTKKSYHSRFGDEQVSLHHLGFYHVGKQSLLKPQKKMILEQNEAFFLRYSIIHQFISWIWFQWNILLLWSCDSTRICEGVKIRFRFFRFLNEQIWKKKKHRWARRNFCHKKLPWPFFPV